MFVREQIESGIEKHERECMRRGERLFLSGLEHSGRNFGHEAAWNEAFTVRAEIISEAGNHIALSSGEGFQAGARDFLSGLGFFPKFLLAGDLMKFRFC